MFCRVIILFLAVYLFTVPVMASNTLLHNGVTAHRGNSSEYPENTMPAFKSALALGVDWIELDIHMTKDGQVVVIHDRDTERVAGIYMLVSAVTYEELKGLDVAHYHREKNNLTMDECPPERIPLLSEVIELIVGQDLTRLSIQPKDESVRTAFSIIEELGAEQWVGFNDGSLEKMIQVKTLAADIPVFWDRRANTDIDRDIEIALEQGFEAIVVHQDGITEELVRKVRAAGFEVGSWTVNDADRMQSFLEMGVQRLYTDYPAVMLRLIEDY